MTDLLDLIEARQRRDDGIALVDASEPTAWSRAAEQAIAEFAHAGAPFCAEDVREVVGDPRHPNALGSVFMRAVRSGSLEQVGHVQCVRKQARGRWQPQYRGVR